MEHGVQIVRCCCEHSSRAGVQPGMTLAHARALLTEPDCRVEPFDPRNDEAALKKLASWMTRRYSPTVAADPPDGLLIDITGCERLFGGERSLLERIRNDLARQGFHTRLAAASTSGCAWALARFGEHDITIIPHGEERQSLKPLSVRALRLPEETIEALHEVEIGCIAHLLDLPRASLADRFGPELLWQLNQALGQTLHALDPQRDQPPPSADRIFDGPVLQLEAIELTARELLESLCSQLLSLESGALKLEVELRRIYDQPARTSITLSHPTRNVKHLWSLLWPKVENINLGDGVETIALTASRIGRMAHEQVEHWLDRTRHIQQDQKAAELIDTLIARLGESRVLRVHRMESHVPEMAFTYRSAAHTEPTTSFITTIITTPPPPDFDRPSQVWSKHEGVDVETCHHQPVRMCWRHEHLRIVECIGPERIALPWWKHARADAPPLLARDYFRVQDDRGRWLWLYQFNNTGRWFLHGAWA